MRAALLLLTVGCAADLDEPSLDWTDRAPMLAPLQENAVVVLDGEVVVVGGIGTDRLASARVEAWSPDRDVWRSLPDLPVARHHVNAAVVGDRLYALGGLDSLFAPQPECWVLEGQAWTALPPLPAGRARGASLVGVLDGQIHLIGGVAGDDVPWHDVFDPDKEQWSTLDDAPVARDHGGAAVLAETLYAVGGRHRAIDSHLPQLWSWDGSDWRQHPPMPTSRGGLAVAALGDRLHAIGGEGHAGDASGVFDVHEAYDPESNRWETLDPPNVPRHGTGAAVVDGVLYLPGGADKQGLGPVDALEAYEPSNQPS